MTAEQKQNNDIANFKARFLKETPPITFKKPKLFVDDGIYDLKIVRAENKSSMNGNAMIKLKVEVVGHQLTFDAHLVDTPKAYWMFAQFLTAMGESLDDGAAMVLKNYVGRIVRAEVGRKTFEHREYQEIKRWLPPEDANSTPQVPATDEKNCTASGGI